MRQEKQPASTEVTEVAPNVLRMQLPVEMPGLGHVNCYALEDDRGVALVDPGLPDESTANALDRRLADAGYATNDVHTVIVTHSHLDHFGQTNRLRELAHVDVVTHASFAPFYGGHDPDEMIDLDIDIDIDDDEQLDELRARRRGTTSWGTPVEPPSREELRTFLGTLGGRASLKAPSTTHPLEDAEVVSLARREWLAVHTPGHTHDHLCLYDPVEGIMLSGDHVLPTITPHIAGNSPLDDPLATFFASLEKMRDYADVRTVLPAHGHPFTDLPGRSDEIRAHHEDRLGQLREVAAADGLAPVESYMKHLFRERSWGTMAASETYAHLEHLRLTGAVDLVDVDGVKNYTSPPV